MSNYVQATNFATKDALPSGDPLKIVKGTEINIEYTNIAVAVATKADLASPTFTGVPLAPTAATGTSTTQLATTAFANAAFQGAYPVGSIYMNASVATNPGTLLGFGTWSALGAGRMLLGDGGGFAAGATGGSATTTLSTANLPSHTHTATVTDPGHLHAGGRVPFLNNGIAVGGNDTTSTPGNTSTAFTGITVSNSSTGSGTAATTISPYLVVYMWSRTA